MCLTLRAAMHFELIFVTSARSLSRFILLHVGVWLFQHHLLKRVIFTTFHFLFSSVKDQLTIFMLNIISL